jgi:hypothetical protein
VSDVPAEDDWDDEDDDANVLGKFIVDRATGQLDQEDATEPDED